MDYKKTVEDIVSNIGGEDNVLNVSHCMTRLRFVLKDENKVNKENVELISGVLGSTFGAGQYQVVMGKNLDGAYSALMKNYHFESASSVQEKSEKKNWNIKTIFKAIVDYMSGSVSPVITGLMAGGILKLFLYLATLISPNIASNSTYSILAIIANTPFYFMPVLVAYGASRKLDCSPVLPILLACTLLDPSYLALEGSQKLFGLNVPLISYSSTVIPTMLSTLLVCYVDKFMNKVIPGIVKNVLATPLSFLVSYVITITFLAPLGNYIGVYVVNALVWIDSFAAPLALGSFTAVLQFMIMAGVHTLVAPFMLENFSSLGYDSLFRPGLLLCLLAVSGAAMGVALRQKDKTKRVDYISIGVSSVLAGISEPGIFGINMKHKSALIGCSIGGFVGGITGGLLGIKAYVMTKNTILALPVFQNTIIQAAISCLVTFAVSFMITYIFYKEKNIKKEEKVLPVVKGKRIPIEDVKDDVFSKKMMGDGFAIIPEDNKIVAPFNGKIVTVFPTKHAFGIVNKEGVEAIIHIGLDTVKEDGKGFKSFVSENQQVKAGQVLCEVDFEDLRNKGYDTTTIVAFSDLKNKSLSWNDKEEIAILS